MPFTYTLLSPEKSCSRASLLEFDGVRILADPGWDGVSDINYLKSIVSTADIIVLSQPTTDFCGAFAWLAFEELNAPVYATLPTTNLGRVATIDMYRAQGIIGPLKGTEYELNDVEEAFDKIITVKHSQTTDLRAKYDGLTITAVNSGHALGGTIWVLNKNSEKVVYAPVWNHSKDSFLNGADIMQNPLLLRPSVVITSSAIGSALSHKRRVEKFFELVDATLGRGGTVLLPTSIGGRMLELIHLIDDHLQSAPIPVLLVAYAKARSLTYAGSMLEWMAPAVIKEWEARGQVPFDASRVQVLDPRELSGMPGAKVVFASGVGFENGTEAQVALSQLCEDEKTTIILTERALEGTIGSDLFFTWQSLAKGQSTTSEEGVPVPLTKQIQVQHIREDLLSTYELKDYEDEVKARRARKEKAKKSKNTEKAQIQFEDESESDSEDEDILASTKKVENIPIDTDVRTAKGRARMFPYIPAKVKYDDYGSIINHADYAREEEKDVSKLKKKEQKGKLGEKKKWNEGKKQDDVSDLDPLFSPKSRSVIDLFINSRCALSFIDLAGVVDIRSLSLILPSLKPKNVLLISDLTNCASLGQVSSALKKHNRFDVEEMEANTPYVVDNTIQSFDILLDDSLSSKLKWQKITGGFTVAHVVGEVKTKEELTKDKEVKDEDIKMEDIKLEDVKMEDEAMETKTEEDIEMESVTAKDELVLVPLDQPSGIFSNIRAAPLAIGDVRLSELKKNLSGNYKVEFKGEGTLVIDDVVAVRKVTDGDVIVDGAPGPLFYEVRNAVRSMLAYV